MNETHLVQLDIASESLGAGGVQIARQNGAALLPGGDRKRSDARKAIDDDVRSLERRDEAGVLGLKSRVPVNFRKVEAELAVVLRLSARDDTSAPEASREDDVGCAYHLDLKVWLACKDLHLEISVHVVDHVEFVDHSAQGLVFLRNGDER